MKSIKEYLIYSPDGKHIKAVAKKDVLKLIDELDLRALVLNCYGAAHYDRYEIDEKLKELKARIEGRDEKMDKT